jgi:hypothetical protein
LTSPSISRCQIQIDNVLVARVCRIDGEARNSDDFLIRPGVAEGGAVGERLAADDFERLHFGVDGDGRQQQDEQREPEGSNHVRSR